MPLMVTLLVVGGCTGKDKGAGSAAKSGKQLSGESLLSKIPTSTAAFSVMDFGGEGYNLFIKSPYGGGNNAKKSIDAMVEKVREAGAGDELVSVMRRVLDSGVQLGLIAADGTYTVEKVVSRSVLFGGPASNAQLPVEAGLFLRAAPGVVMSEKLDILRKELSGTALKVADESITGATKGFTVALEQVSAKVYFAASTELFGLALSKSAIEGLFSSANTGAIEAIQTSPEYKQATTPLVAPEDPFAFTFASLTRLRPLLDAVAKADESGEFKPNELPFDALAFQASFPKQYVHNIGLAVAPKTDVQTKVFAALQDSALSPATTKLPADAAFSIALDTRFLGKLEPMIKSIEESAPAGVTDHVKQLQSITLGLRNNAAGSPLPDIFMIMESAGREQLESFLQSALGMAMSLAGQAASWQTKDIEGVKAKYVTTMIGAGVYMGTPANLKAILLGSSDGVLKDMIATQAGKSAGASASMPEQLKSQITSANVASFYFNFKKIADTIDSAKNTLAMFTGGNTELNDMLESANIRAWGLAAGGISYTPGVLAINSSFEAAAQ